MQHQVTSSKDRDERRARLKEQLLSLPPDARRGLLKALPPETLERLAYDWAFWRRPEQATPSGDWRYWLALAGRGWGKTRVGAEFIREQVTENRAKLVGIVARTLGDARDTMICGKSGLLACHAPHERPVWIESRRSLVWPNGAIGYVYTTEEPDLLRGPGLDLLWGDELAAWLNIVACMENIDFVLRETGPKGDQPRAMFTTTPRPIPQIRDMVKAAANADPMYHVTRGRTYDNAANLDPGFFRKLKATYEGTRIGRQELDAEILDDVEGALWTSARIDACRVKDYPALPKLLIGVDPAVTSDPKRSSETGIVVVGGGDDGDLYVLEDLSARLSPAAWARRVVDAFYRWEADAVVCEVNNGGDLVAANIHVVDARVPVHVVRATRGKRLRAEPIAALYEKKPARVHHVGTFKKLEEQMTSWTGDAGQVSPDRLDALVWACTKIALEHIDTLEVGFA